MVKNNLSLKDIYQLVDSTRRELNDSIKSLEDKFIALEQGRISNLETKVADMQGRIVATTAVISFVISIALGIMGFILKK